MNIFFEIHKDIPREGPGNNESTRRAYRIVEKYFSKPAILDIACGPGMQTMELAKLTDGTILATDLHEDFLQVLVHKAQVNGLTEKIKTQRADMKQLPFNEEQFDVIWSEGAIYIIGFEKGLIEWKKYLKDNGIVAVTELTWIKENAPQEVRDFWDSAYPGAGTIDSNIKKAELLGYQLIESFVLPEAAWWDDYYRPLEDRLTQLREKYQNNEVVQKAIAETQYEIDLYRIYHDYYGYVFYLFQKQAD